MKRRDDLELARAYAIERDALQAVGEATERVHELRAALAGDRWAIDHADDLLRDAAVRNELASRSRTRVLSARHVEVPAYLTAELGERPVSAHERGIWDRAAVRIEHYRVSSDIAERTSAIGDRPSDLRARGAYYQARRDVDAAKRELARQRTCDRTVAAGRQMRLPVGRSRGR